MLIPGKPKAPPCGILRRVGVRKRQARGQACILYIKNKKDFLNIIIWINGHMRTPKLEALHRLINWYNDRYNTKIPL